MEQYVRVANLKGSDLIDLNIICRTLFTVKDHDAANNSDNGTGGNKRPYEDQIADQLLQVASGHHYLILYSNIETMRRVYSNYIKRQMEEEPDAMVLFLPYYDTTDNVRDVLKRKGVDVKDHEKKGSIVILDILKVINDPYFKVPEIERLRELAKKTEGQFKDKTIFLIADMSVFNHMKKISELLEYEKKLHATLRMGGWKELCLYNKLDFESMFTEAQKNTLMEYHKDKVILVN